MERILNPSEAASRAPARVPVIFCGGFVRLCLAPYPLAAEAALNHVALCLKGQTMQASLGSPKDPQPGF